MYHVHAMKGITYQSHIVVLHQHVAVTLVTIIKVLYNKNTIHIPIIVEKCMINALNIKRNSKYSCYTPL